MLWVGCARRSASSAQRFLVTKVTDLSQLPGEQCSQDEYQTAVAKDGFASPGSSRDALGGGCTGDVLFADVCTRLSNVSVGNAWYAAQLAPLLSTADTHIILSARTDCLHCCRVVLPGLLRGAESPCARFHLPGEGRQAIGRHLSHFRYGYCDTIGNHFRTSDRIRPSVHQSRLRPQGRPPNLDPAPFSRRRPRDGLSAYCAQPHRGQLVRPIEYSEEDMKSKALIIASTFVMALALMAQSTSQTTPPPAENNAKSCACCDHARADGKMACCGKDASCCAKGGACGKDGTCCKGKDGKSSCSMMSKDSSGKMGCCAGGKCAMASSKDGKTCCGGGKMCDRPQSGA